MSLDIGPIRVEPPVVLAPMAGVTNAPFRRLAREFGAGLYVSEMIGARGLVEGSEKTLALARFDDDEVPRSIQLYGTDPGALGEAVALLVSDRGVDHIDMNFGCPMGKVTRHGGGAALPWKTDLFRSIVRAAVGNAGGVPVTVKFRKGIDDDHLTFLDTGRIAEEEGAAAVALHARTARQLYSGEADWSAIGELKRAVSTIPVLGNGDIWTAEDARRMVHETGCDGVVVGRGCLGRPWLFRDLADVFAGRTPETPPLSDRWAGSWSATPPCWSTISATPTGSTSSASTRRGTSRGFRWALLSGTRSPVCLRWRSSPTWSNSSTPMWPFPTMPIAWCAGTVTARVRSGCLTGSSPTGPAVGWTALPTRSSAGVDAAVHGPPPVTVPQGPEGPADEKGAAEQRHH